MSTTLSTDGELVTGLLMGGARLAAAAAADAGILGEEHGSGTVVQR